MAGAIIGCVMLFVICLGGSRALATIMTSVLTTVLVLLLINKALS